MSDYVFSKHALGMMTERNILEDWVRRTLNEPGSSQQGEDGNLRFTKAIAEKR